MTKKNVLLIIFLLFVEACMGYGISKQFLRKNLIVENWLNAASSGEILGEDYARMKLNELEPSGAGMSDENVQTESQAAAAPEEEREEVKVQVARATESSHIEQEGKDNTAYAAIDGDVTTSWQEGVSGAGEGSWIRFELQQEYEITFMTFNLGNWNDEKDYYNGNNRPKELLVKFGDGNDTYELPFPDEKQQFQFDLETPIRTNVVEIEIQSVYPGDSWDDTCIAEVGIYGMEL